MVPLHRLTALLLAAGLLLSTAGSAFAADTADVRVLHASPDAPAVDIYVDDEIVDALTDVPFGTISDYLAIPAGAHNVKVYATGTTSDPVIDADVTLTADAAYTVAATGALADITAQVLEDDPSPSASTAQVRVVHFSADAPAVDIAPAGATVDEAVVKNLAYPDATDYLGLPGGTYDLEVRLAGETTVALELSEVAVENGRSYSVFAVGSAASPAVGSNALQAVVAVDGTAAVPAPADQAGPAATVPPTDTITTDSAPSQSFGPLIVALLSIGAISFVIGSSVLARRANED